MRVALVLGGTGQIGHEVIRALDDFRVVAPTRAEVDLRSLGDVRELVRNAKPSVVVNAAGYTAVDAAESDVDTCALLNAELPGVLGEACGAVGACLVHFSTDYVFDGTKRVPYAEADATNPLSVYGRTKLDGERAALAGGGACLVFRTSWVYGARGRNFALTMLRLAHEREELRVVDDQIGAPTSAGSIARGVCDVLATLERGGDARASCEAAAGVYHMTAGGSTTWFEFARRILDDDPRRETQTCRSLVPIPTAEYRTAAQRPAYSVLDNGKLRDRFGVQLPSWEVQWQDVAAELRDTGR